MARQAPEVGLMGHGRGIAAAWRMRELSGDRDSRRWWSLGVLISALALAAVATSAPGWYVGDNRFEQFWAPGRVLGHLPFLWDSSRGLGRPLGDFTLVPGVALGFLRALGVSPAATERLWHAGLLATAGLGAVAFLRLWRSRPGPEHLVAGLFYAFNSYAAVFLVPSGLFLNYALAPWLLVAFVQGVMGARPWRWAAMFALLVLASGTFDPPGLLYSLVLVVPIALYTVVERQAAWRDVAAWLGRAGALSLAVSAAALVQVATASFSLSARLFSTESATAINSVSSWSESWRGLGFWVSYFPLGDRLLRPQHAPYLVSAAMIVATFVPAVAAGATLCASRWRPRLVFGTMAVLSAALMVGSYPVGGPSPLGRFLVAAYDRLPALTAMRTTYKAGSGLALGIAGLAGVGVAALGDHLGRHRLQLRGVPVAAALVVIAVVSFPFWTGRLYSPENRMRVVPDYWSSALKWLDQQPGYGRVLVLPGTSSARYRWGSPGDDLFDALLARPHVRRTALPQGTAQAADLVDAIDDDVVSRRYRPGTLAPIARRLGIDYVLIRNDLDWQRLGRARPADLDALRGDPGLEAVASFGRPGRNVVAAGDTSPPTAIEARLAPVEILRVRGSGASAPTRAQLARAPLLVAGDGSAWFELARQGILGDRPLRYTAATDDETLAGLLNEGAPLVVTDTNRRAVNLLTGLGQSASRTLAQGEQLQRPAGELFARPGSQSVVAYPDAVTVASPTGESGLSGFEPWFRPANAFDGDESTWWLTGGFEDPLGRSVKVDFGEERRLSSVELVAAPQPATGRRVSLASIILSDGTTALVELSSGRGRVELPPRATKSLEIHIQALTGPGLGPVGLAEVKVTSLDLTEVVQLPDDVFRAADRSPSLAGALARAPVSYVFERVQGDGPRPIEVTMRRRFRSLDERSYQLDGTMSALATDSQALPGGTARCRPDLVTIDGKAVSVRVEGPSSGPGGPVAAFRSCEPVVLGSGWHDLVGISSVDSARLTTGPDPVTSAGLGDEVRIGALSRDPTRLRFTIQVPPGGAWMVGGESYDRGWNATVDGVDLGAAQPLDAQSAWLIQGQGTHTVDIRYRPQRLYDVALVVSGTAVAVCIALVARRRRAP